MVMAMAMAMTPISTAPIPIPFLIGPYDEDGAMDGAVLWDPGTVSYESGS